MDPNLVKRGRQQGYHDYKHLLYGDESSGPLSIDLELSKESPIILCETPGIYFIYMLLFYVKHLVYIYIYYIYISCFNYFEYVYNNRYLGIIT